MMAYKSLREFLQKLDAETQHSRVSAPVSTVLKMTEILARLLATQGPAVLFQKPVSEFGPAEMPVHANLFGTVERVVMAVTLDGQR